jgi:hypothetical protein
LNRDEKVVLADLAGGVFWFGLLLLGVGLLWNLFLVELFFHPEQCEGCSRSR